MVSTASIVISRWKILHRAYEKKKLLLLTFFAMGRVGNCDIKIKITMVLLYIFSKTTKEVRINK
jgi:ABC-type uncharacterized transport system involved in gliding motility auxiliary subunit